MAAFAFVSVAVDDETEYPRRIFKPAALGYEAGVIGAALWGTLAAADALILSRES